MALWIGVLAVCGLLIIGVSAGLAATDGDDSAATERVVPTDHETIEAAIEAAEPNDKILVEDGTYEESLTIDKPLTLRSVSEGEAVLDGGGDLERAITVESEDVTVEGFRIEGYTASGEDNGAVYIDADRFTFRNNIITGSIDAVQVYDNIDEFLIANNDIHDNEGSGIDLRFGHELFTIDGNEIERNKNGIIQQGPSRNSNQHGTIRDNTIAGNTGQGISDGRGIELSRSGSNNNLILDNTVTGNDGGIEVGDDEVRDNHVTVPDGNAIRVDDGATVADNTIEDANIGIESRLSSPLNGALIKDNKISDVSVGIGYGGDDLTVRRNEFSDTETDLELDEAVRATITDNEFVTGVHLNGVPENLDQEPHEMSGNTVAEKPLFYAGGPDEDNLEIPSNAAQVILVGVTDVHIDGHSFSDVASGVQVAYSEDVTVTDTEFTNINAESAAQGPDGAARFWHSTSVTVSDSSFIDNSVGLRQTGDDPLDARNNWWGEKDGPSGDVSDHDTGKVADGNGDRIIGENVRFDPYLEAPIGDAGTLSGTVTDTDGEPIVGATVEASGDGETGTTETETDADGNYELTLPAGTYEVTTSAGGYEPKTTSVDLTAEETATSDVVLTPLQAKTIIGTVVSSETDDPIADAEVEIFEQIADGEPTVVTDGFTTTVSTDANGEFDVEVPVGSYQLTINALGFDEGVRQNIVVDSETATELDPISLAAVPVLTGVVTDSETDESIEGADVESRFFASEPRFTATTSATGEYAINIPQHSTQTPSVAFNAAGYQEKIITADESVVDTGELDVELSAVQDPSAISGTVTKASDQPVADVEIMIVDVESGELLDVEGIPFEDAHGGEFDRELSEGDLDGEFGGIDVDGTVGEVDTSSRDGETDEDGQYAVQVPPGTYDVSIFSDEWIAHPVTDVSVAEGEAVEGVDLEVQERPDFEDVDLTVEILDDESVVTVEEGDEITVVSEVRNDEDGVTTGHILGLVIVDSIDEGELPLNGELRDLRLPPQLIEPGETVTETFSFDATLAHDGVEAVVASSMFDDPEPFGFDSTVISVSSAEEEEEEEAATPSPGGGGGGGGSGGGAASPPETEPELEVIEASVSPAQLEIGDEATVDATVENVGEDDGELTVPLNSNGEEIDSTTVDLDAGEQTDVTFTVAFEEAGTFSLDVDGVDAGAVAVIEEADSDVVIYGADVNRSSLLLGETVAITGDLLNNGGSGTFDVDLNVNGDVVDSTTVEVSPGATPSAVEFEWTPTEADLPADADEMNAAITLNGFVVDTVHITNPYSDITVIQTSSSALELVEGEEMYVVGSLYQRGTIKEVLSRGPKRSNSPPPTPTRVRARSWRVRK